ncbi:MAG: hypothetical protein M3R02_20715 [Chloroflexota bacterium]|nr:hypothetical protein [Chloroflexota bacterium]
MAIRGVIAEMYEQVAESARRSFPPEVYPPEDLRPFRPPPEPTPEEAQRPAPPRPVQPVQTPVGRRGVRRAEVAAALSSPSGVRQALVLQEILGPPISLRGWDDG